MRSDTVQGELTYQCIKRNSSRFQNPHQSNSNDCGIYAILFMIHLRYSNKINDSISVPNRYLLPEETIPHLDGHRLLLLEEMAKRNSLV